MKKVYITGIGAITSIGQTIESTWSNLLGGISGVKPLDRFQSLFDGQIKACEIEDFPQISPSPSRHFGKSTSLFLKAVQQAMESASFTISSKSIVGISIGTTMGEIDSLEKGLFENKVIQAQGGPNVISESLYDYLGLNGPAWTITNACAAGNIAIARAMDDIQNNNAEVMIVGGVDILSRIAISGFNSLHALSDLCAPFDRNRKGLVLGEGAGVLILESEEHLLSRKVQPKAQLFGYGLSCDGHHITQPDPLADGAVIAMEAAFSQSSIEPRQIGYISAHGTGTVANDLMENTAINRVFPNQKPPVSSIKGHIGHTLGAASAIEAAISVKILEEEQIPHTLNLAEQDPQIDMNVIKNEPIRKRVDYILSNSYAFGGVNTSIIIGRCC